jgi:hypothetical protein
MDIQVEHSKGDDYGYLVVTLGADDDIELSGSGRCMTMRLPLYNYEAQEIMDKLQPVAKTPTP